MTTNEIVYMLTANQKAYAGIMTQQYFSSYIRRIKAGTCKPKPLAAFLYKFGYEPIDNLNSMRWEKK